MGPNILFSAIWRDRGGGSNFQKGLFCRNKRKQSPRNFQKAMIFDEIDKVDLGMIYSYIFQYSYHIIY